MQLFLFVGQEGVGRRGTKKAKQGMAIYLFIFYFLLHFFYASLFEPRVGLRFGNPIITPHLEVRNGLSPRERVCERGRPFNEEIDLT
jgi:hypothetical protein